MSAADRERWNERFRVQGAGYDPKPSEWLVALEPTLRPRRESAPALDLACGGGRHSLYLAGLGYRVDAWDVSEVGLDLLRAELERRRLVGNTLDVSPRQVDLDQAMLPAGRYDLVLVSYYLERAHSAGIAAALRPGGLLIFHTFLQAAGIRIAHAPANPAYVLQPGELAAAFSTLETLEYLEDPNQGVARLVARRPG